MTRSPEMSEVLGNVRAAAASDVNVARWATVTRWDPATQQIDAAPAVKLAYTDEGGQRQLDSLPVITSVPVQFPGSGQFAVTFPVALGDWCLLIFADHSLDKLLAVGGTPDPEDPRCHSVNDATAILGVRPFCSPLRTPPAAGCMQIGNHGAGAVFDFAALGGSLQTWLDNHTHTVVCPPGGGTVTSSKPLSTSPAPSATVKVSQ